MKEKDMKNILGRRCRVRIDQPTNAPILIGEVIEVTEDGWCRIKLDNSPSNYKCYIEQLILLKKTNKKQRFAYVKPEFFKSSSTCDAVHSVSIDGFLLVKIVAVK